CRDLGVVSGGNATGIAGVNSLVTQEKRVASARRGCGSCLISCSRTSHCNLQRSLDWKGRACGLAFQVTGLHIIGLVLMGLNENLDLLIAI
ncbi:hypothetical protein Cfor_07830, partial [Coptotermes formosanus]